jgi:predicted HTH domain antitoxin
MRITVEIPDDLAAEVVSSGRDPARVLLEDFAAECYREGKLTMEQLRQLLGLGTRLQVDIFLQQRGIYDYSVQDLEKDLSTLDRVERSQRQA